MDWDLLAYDAAPVGIVVTAHRVIRGCNASFAQMLGYEREALIGQSFRLLYNTTEEFERVRDIGLAPLRAEHAYSDERMVRRRDGAQIWCRFRAQTRTPEEPLAQLVMSFAVIQDGPSVALTLRQRQVVSGLGRGLTSKEIARELGLSPRTVEDVRARLLKRFEVKNAAELLAHLTIG
ncbi:PAS and helix-turn-helix domain-containing protein [Shimia marina]|uniref:Transcriptional regulatory protein UhpA n=1 Tax=Shimia marina TaxID=321267 RepID=A0A0P1FEG9_9RHOB|nr:PAS and helix-turn-helix domain-containing protein [Shimia marina]CUH54007.1 Transcriptional regulatory protein UhpA [Shimia marina]SFE17053.1 PAS domain S-box-containing protein [Shimia marina]